MAQVPITIDGRRIEVEEGSYVLQAATALGIEIPTLCYYKYVTPYAACRICCVEVKDRAGAHADRHVLQLPAWRPASRSSRTRRA